MESVNLMAKVSHVGGGGGVGTIKSHRRRIVSEPTESLVSQSQMFKMQLE